MRRLVVIGGGISGLAAAWAARSRAHPADGLEITVLERGAQVGGVADSIARDGWLVETGPNGFLSGSPAVDQLIAAAGVTDRVQGANPAARRRYIYWRGRLRRVTANPFGLLGSGLLSPAGVARLFSEIAIARRRDPADETIDAFIARRFGVEAAERLARPMTLGVFAGDARALSLAATFPQLAQSERDHRSIIRGVLARRGAGPRRTLTSFAGGMGVLPRELARRGGFDVRCNATASAITREATAWQVHLAGGGAPLVADAVIVAIGPHAASELLRSINTIAATELAAIETPPVSVVALGYEACEAARIPVGFGVLIARDSGFRMLGNLWESQIFPGRAPDSHVLIRALYGGGGDRGVAALAPDELLTLARAEVRRLYGLQRDPVFEEAVHWPQAIPQYAVGHGARVARIEKAMAQHPGLFIAGSALHGVAFSAAAAAGIETGQRAVALFGEKRSPD